MNLLHHDPPWKTYLWLGAIGALIYLLLQIMPATSDSFFTGNTITVMEKDEAQEIAADFVRERFGAEPTSTHAIHQSDRLLSGYLAKTESMATYEQRYDARFPVDTYQVEVRTPRINSAGGESLYYVYLHMETGEVVSWNRLGNPLPSEQPLIDYEPAVEAAKTVAAARGFRTEELTALPGIADTGTVVLRVVGSTLDEAELQLHIRSARAEDGTIRTVAYKPEFDVPQPYRDYVKQQDQLGAALSLGGYFGLTAVLFILSIIYAAVYRRHTSFLRGIALTVIFFALYVANNYNMADGLRAGIGETPDADSFVSIGLIINVFIVVAMAASVYFALVAGDGLWRSAGRRLWPRFGESGYGEHVWRSMKLSYLLAFAMLGIQTLILLLLQEGIGAWATSDVTQSPYNFGAPWLFPVLAWCAAISEEAVYRLFGIGLLRKWFKNLFVASLIPTIIWALGHVTYPIYPATTRLIELTIVGLLFSFIFLRFGFITAVFTHAIVNTVMMAAMLILLGTPINVLAGILYLLLPVPIAWLLREWSRRRAGREPLGRPAPPEPAGPL
ncbi:CPBP family intramembrane metalloprotease [Paenibacillus sp. IB182496]|uniref:CPBP family intramembrane metalloprotease n=1 Tax=Paenibacillus sabuli TaxID=2772509 RepID=A0A927BTR9_9BACL|nr:type II CAAX endopeptidase family protein [Paenibacillus sabuli]MBD2845736.1 CPBP family intramembrane metalloprotease [Paenibacillus sabuli]